ncbi:putative guanine aminohydrolase [Naematelia encephala]|uniref:Putative guanine aminohydrolase n=1 Tax=Naematelia encephala TaxID=71784 RepID=A0A1Y2BAE5_9TREE|nr:putative guanine aminohydrolase [Naematelia encephala]
MSQLFIGTFIDTPSPSSLSSSSSPSKSQLQIRKSHLLVTSQGIITHLSPSDSPSSQSILSDPSSPAPIFVGGKYEFFLPTYTDLHLHAPQYLYAGTGLDMPLMQWLDQYAYRAEEKIDSDLLLARRVYERLCLRLKQGGTGCVSFFGSLGVDSNMILAECVQKAGLRGFIGKLSMDQSPRPTYGEPSTEVSLASVTTFLDRMDELVSSLPPHERLVEPILTPRFVPTCSDELLSGLSKISKERGVRVQSHMCESADQMAWVESTRGKRDEEVWDEAGLLGDKTLQAHVTTLPPDLISVLKSRGVTCAHCPLSNAYFSDAQFPLREALDAELKVGLGSDIAGGYSLSIETSMRQAVVTARLREGARREGGGAVKVDEKGLRVDWVESLYVATRGGKMAMGLGGCFEIGMEFDAQLIQVADEKTDEGTGKLDFFDLANEEGEDVDDARWTELVERWWCNGDDRNRKGMWIQGKRLS